MDKNGAETYSVHIWRQPETGRILKMEWRDPNGDLHKPDGPALEEWAPSGRLVKQEFHLHGARHRSDGPATTQWDPITGIKVLELWCLGDRLHRDNDLPAYVERDRNSGIATATKYFQNGQLHRELGPASIYRDAQSGVSIRQVWMRHAEYHRSGDQPAVIDRDPETAVITEERYVLNGVTHRDLGPAYIRRNPHDGSITEEVFYVEGKRQLLDRAPS